jgi:hypothetical protein
MDTYNDAIIRVLFHEKLAISGVIDRVKRTPVWQERL